MENTATTLFDLNKDQLSVAISSVRSKLKELGLDTLNLNLYKRVLFGKDNCKQATLIVEGSVSSTLKEKINQLSTELGKIGIYGSDAYAVQVETCIRDGDKFPLLKDLNDLNAVPNKESGKTFECPEGEVVLVDFWATWCGPCQQPMQHNQEMLEKNDVKWKGKVRIVGVSVDNDIESVIKRVEERKWDKIEHYHAPGGFDAPAAAQFDIRGIPCVFLVDKQGIIKFRGHPSSVNLEDKINELIAEDGSPTNTSSAETKKEDKHDGTLVCTEEGCSIVPPKNPSTLSIDAENELIKQFQEKHEANKYLIEKVPGITTGIITNRIFRPEGKEIFNARLLINGLINPPDKETVIEYWRNVLKSLSGDLYVENGLCINDLPEIRYGKGCATCKKTLGKGVPHYVCTYCLCEGEEDYAFCVECSNKELTQEINSSKDLFHQHGLLLLSEDSDKALKSLKRVMNNVWITTDDDPDFEEVKAKKGCQGIRCDICRQSPILNYRWACACCSDFDYCSDCLKASKDPNHERHKEVVEKSLEKGHDTFHIFYRSHYLLYIQSLPPKGFEFPTTD